MTAAGRRAALDRTRRQLDTPAPTVPGQLTTDDPQTKASKAVQLPIFAVAGGAYWKAWRTS